MALNTSILTAGTPRYFVNSNQSVVKIDESFPYIVSQGFHAGYLDRSKWKVSLDAYIGVGLNPIGLYGVEYDSLGNLPKFLLAAKSVSEHPSWGEITAGEFRTGDNVKEDNGSLVGENWLWYKPGKGLEVSGPLLRSTSSDVNIIQSPSFNNTAEFNTYGLVVHETGTGYQGDCYKFTGNGYINVKGYKTVDGATTLRGSILYYADANFDGTVKLMAQGFDVDKNSLGISNSIINVSTRESWKRYNFILRLDNTDTFVLFLQVTSATTGEIKFDNWNAYKVFQTAFSSADMPETLPAKRKEVVIDRSGIHGYWVDEDDPTIICKNFEFSAADGNAFLRGNLLVNGTVHSGRLYDKDNLEIIEFDFEQVEYYSGCGINEFGVYGINATIIGGNHSASIAKFLLGAKDINFGGSPSSYWGTEITQGEFRVGDDVRKTSPTTLNGDKYIWFDGSNFRLKGINLEISSGNYIWVGIPTSDGCGITEYGVAGTNNGTATFILAADDIPDGTADWYGVHKGDLRIGSNVLTVAGSSLVYDNNTGSLSVSGIINATSGSFENITLSGNIWAGSYPSGVGFNDAAIGMYYDGKPKFRIEQAGISGDTNWGTQAAGSLKFATDIRNVLSATNYGLYFENGILSIKTENFSIDSSGNVSTTGAVVATSGSITGDLEVTGSLYSGDTYLNTYGISGTDGTDGVFLLSAKGGVSSHALWGDVSAGEFRVGDGVKRTGNSLNGSNYFWYDTVLGIQVKANGVEITDSGTTIGGGGTATNLSSLGLTGNLTLDGGYIKLTIQTSGAASSTYLDNTGFSAFGVDGYCKILLATKDHAWTGTEPEFRIGENVQSLSGEYLSYVPGTGLTVSGTINATDGNFSGTINITSGGAVITGTEASGAWSAHNYSGFSCGYDSKYTFIVANTTMSGLTTPMVAGEFRIGEAVGDIPNSDNYLRYVPSGATPGLTMKCNGITVDNTNTVFGGDSATNFLYGLTVSGILELDKAVNSYIVSRGPSSGNDWIALNYTGIAGHKNGVGYTFHLSNTNTTGWTVETVPGEFRVGNGVDSLSGNYLRYNPTDSVLTVKGAITATSGAITGTLTVGTANQIQIVGGTASPYIQSDNYLESGSLSTGWKIAYDGIVNARHIDGTGGYITLGAYEGLSDFAQISAYRESSAYSDINLGVASSTSTANIHIVASTVGMVSIKSSSSVNLGDSTTPTINIKPTSTGRVNLGYASQIQIDNNEIGFFEASPTTKQTIDLDTGTSWDGATTAAGNRADINTLADLINRVAQALEDTTFINYTPYT